MCCRAISENSGNPGKTLLLRHKLCNNNGEEHQLAQSTVIDPVCGMRLDSVQTQFVSDYEGMRYYFCSESCKHRFDQDPEAYLESNLTATNLSE